MGADFNPKPPVTRLSPEEQQKRFLLPPGYRIEPVLTDPLIQDPVGVTFDGNGRMYVLEMRSYMQDAEGSNSRAPISRISRHEDTDGDGTYDRHTVFVDKMVMPRIAFPRPTASNGRSPRFASTRAPADSGRLIRIMTALDNAIVLIYFAIVFGIGAYFFRRAKTSRSYFLADKSVGWVAIGASLFAANISSEHFIGLAGSGASSGLAVGHFEWLAVFMCITLGVGVRAVLPAHQRLHDAGVPRAPLWPRVPLVSHHRLDPGLRVHEDLGLTLRRGAGPAGNRRLGLLHVGGGDGRWRPGFTRSSAASPRSSTPSSCRPSCCWPARSH